MKKAFMRLSAVFLIIVVLATLSNIQLLFFQIKYGKRTPALWLGELRVYCEDDRIIVLSDSNGHFEFAVVYDASRTVRTAINCDPISNADGQQFIDLPYDTLQKKIGEYHINTGEGFFTPSYLTTDGYVLCFRLMDNTVWLAQKYDLFTGESVELYASPR